MKFSFPAFDAFQFCYFSLCVLNDCTDSVSRLEGFVSNREQSYEDPIEE